MDCEGILKACTMKVVPKRASRTVTRSDSAYSAKVLRFGSDFARSGAPTEISADWGIELSASINSFRRLGCSLREFPTRFARHLALLLFCCGLPMRKVFCPHATLRLRKFFGVQAPIRCGRGIRREGVRAAGAIPAMRICGRRVRGRRRG